MALFVALVLALLSIALLAWPLLRREHSPLEMVSLLASLDDLRVQRQRIFDDIQTLNLDHELGNIRAGEYEDDLRDYRLKAAYLLREEERLQQALAYLEREVEDEVLNLRKSWGTVKRVTTCGTCGGEMDATALVCPRCALAEVVAPSPEEEERRG